MTISFAVRADPTSREDWFALATRAEELGFEALSIADHPGITASPFVALAAAAQVATRLLLAPAVINDGAWHVSRLSGRHRSWWPYDHTAGDAGTPEPADLELRFHPIRKHGVR